jgi:hypothetical protein
LSENGSFPFLINKQVPDYKKTGLPIMQTGYIYCLIDINLAESS